MVALLYDGSWNGLLTAVFELYSNKYNVVDCKNVNHINNAHLFGEKIEVVTDVAKAERVKKGLQQKISERMLRELKAFFLAEEKNTEMLLLQFMQQAFASSITIENDYSNSLILHIKDTVKKVFREKHRMEAFVRFQLTKDGLYYAVVEPDFNVLPLIAKHFKERYADQRWLIFDSYRRYGIYYNLHEVEEVQVNFNANATADIIAEDEPLYQQLWQTYFKSVNIAARKNTKLHIQHMPKRYWKYLVENQA
jgi:probable DNA metabolism protein